MYFHTWRWGVYFSCPLFAFGTEFCKTKRERWGRDHFVRFDNGRFLLAWAWKWRHC